MPKGTPGKGVSIVKETKSAMLRMTEGNTVKLLLLFSVPMLIGNIFQQLYNLVDSIIVGQFVGADALAAIGATSSLSFLFFALCNGIGGGGGIITSQLFGKGDEGAVKSCIANTGYIMIVFPMMIGMTAFFLSKSILRLLDTPEAIMADSVAYVRIMCVGLAFVSLYNYAASMLRALGDSRTPLLFLIFSCLLNTALDLLFVYTFHMGVRGAGIATVISQFVSGMSCLAYAIKKNSYFRLTREDMRFNRKIAKDVVRLGVPISLQFSLIAISCMALQKVVNSFGEVTVAAFTATSRIEQIIHQPYQTLGAALSTYTGQNYGAKKMDRVKMGYHKGLLLMLLFSAMMLPVMQIFGQGIIRIFVSEEPVIEIGAKALRITSWFYVMLGMIYVVRGVLNGLGDAVFAMINGIVEALGRFIVPALLVGLPAFGLWGIWWSVGIVWAASGVTAVMRYWYFKWKIQRKMEQEKAV